MTRFTDRATRSDKYQYLLLEISTDFTPGDGNIATTWSNDHALYQQGGPEVILEIQDRAIERLWELCSIHLTERQSEILQLLGSGMTQWEAARHLNVNQSSVNKTLNGNQSYENTDNSKPPIRHGGVEKKIKNACLEDDKFRSIIFELAELDEGIRIISIVRSWFDSIEEYNGWKDYPINSNGISTKKIKDLHDYFAQIRVPSKKEAFKLDLAKQYKLTWAQLHTIYDQWLANLKEKNKMTAQPKEEDRIRIILTLSAAQVTYLNKLAQQHSFTVPQFAQLIIDQFTEKELGKHKDTTINHTVCAFDCECRTRSPG